MAKMTAIAGSFALAALALTACVTDPHETVVATSDIVTIRASGSSAQLGAMDAWRSEFHELHPGVRIDYRANDSGAGVRDFIQGLTAFAGSDVPMRPKEQALADKRCGSRALHLPMVVGPIAVAYNLPSVPALKLSPDTLAGVFSGRITRWNAPELAADNRGARLPSTKIQVIHRSDDSGTSHNFTTYLKAAGGWPYEPSRKWPAPGRGVETSSGVTEAVKETEGAIGYMEYGFASDAELQTAKVRNAAGEFVALSPESASTSLSGAEFVGENGDLAMRLNYLTKEKGAYPITLVTYEIVCQKGSDPLVRTFLRYTASNAGQAHLSLFGYAPLPPEVIVKVRAQVDALT
ncbi:phosphate transport system substrate-binding protein [Nonomuraea africana]|uniref:Phosphate-binding protein n=2 Tax=Nonomuraea africana TaxID=46171 RepID=A0ABR9KK31_9ACTN|nr:phosphate transport system substrate-binding protein [Nonomuraea africana]